MSIPETTQRSGLLFAGLCTLNGGALVALAAWVFGGPNWIPATNLVVEQLPLLALQGIGLSYLGTMLWYLTIARLDLARATAIVVPSILLLSLVATRPSPISLQLATRRRSESPGPGAARGCS